MTKIPRRISAVENRAAAAEHPVNLKLAEKLKNFFRAPKLTRPRMAAALAVAVAADGLQLCFGFVGWAGLDQAVDLVAMILVGRMIGFHILLLPTFVFELVPVLDDLPTWTACTAAVIALRQRDQADN